MNDTQLNPSNNTLRINRLLKVTDIATALNISRSYAYQLVATGQIPSVRLGTAYRVRPQDLVEFIERNLHNQEPQ